jgi:hypothetical protein
MAGLSTTIETILDIQEMAVSWTTLTMARLQAQAGELANGGGAVRRKIPHPNSQTTQPEDC